MGSGCGVWGLGLGFGGMGLRISGLRGSALRVRGLGFRVYIHMYIELYGGFPKLRVHVWGSL